MLNVLKISNLNVKKILLFHFFTSDCLTISWTGVTYCTWSTSDHASDRQSEQSFKWVPTREVSWGKNRCDKQNNRCRVHWSFYNSNFGYWWPGHLFVPVPLLTEVISHLEVSFCSSEICIYPSRAAATAGLHAAVILMVPILIPRERERCKLPIWEREPSQMVQASLCQYIERTRMQNGIYGVQWSCNRMCIGTSHSWK